MGARRLLDGKKEIQAYTCHGNPKHLLRSFQMHTNSYDWVFSIFVVLCGSLIPEDFTAPQSLPQSAQALMRAFGKSRTRFCCDSSKEFRENVGLRKKRSMVDQLQNNRSQCSEHAIARRSQRLQLQLQLLQNEQSITGASPGCVHLRSTEQRIDSQYIFATAIFCLKLFYAWGTRFGY